MISISWVDVCYSLYPVWVFYIWSGMFGLFALYILVGNPYISFGTHHFFCTCLFMAGVLLGFVLCFLFGIPLVFVLLYAWTEQHMHQHTQPNIQGNTRTGHQIATNKLYKNKKQSNSTSSWNKTRNTIRQGT
jgi:hypothetical protein